MTAQQFWIIVTVVPAAFLIVAPLVGCLIVYFTERKNNNGKH